MLDGNFTLRRTPEDDPVDLWYFLHGEHLKFGLLITTDQAKIDEYIVNAELILRYGYSIGKIGKPKVFALESQKHVWIPIEMTIGTKEVLQLNKEIHEDKAIIKVMVSKKVDRETFVEGPSNLKDSFKSLIHKVSKKNKNMENLLIIQQNIIISQTLMIKTKIVHDFYLLVLENVSSRTCSISKVKSDFETLFSQQLQLLPTEKFTMILDGEKVKSDWIWVNWALNDPKEESSLLSHIWSSTKIDLIDRKSLYVSCTQINLMNGLASMDIFVSNNTEYDMDLQLFMDCSDSLIALQESYSFGIVHGGRGKRCKVEYIVVKRGIHPLPDIKLVDKLNNKNYLLSGVKFQF